MKPTIIDDGFIDWGKPQWVSSWDNGTIILTNGAHTENAFEGTVLPCAEYPNGDFSRSWNKSWFIPIKGVVTLKISN